MSPSTRFWIVVATQVVCTYAAYAGPQMALNPQHVINTQGILVGSNWSQTVTVTNTGDATLIVAEIGTKETDGGPSGWLSVSANSLAVEPGAGNSRQFEVRIDASRYDLPVGLLGEVYLKSNAFYDSVTMYIFVNVNDPTQIVHWDTVASDQYMFDQYFDPEGECVALAVSDHGAMGLPGWRDVGLDYYESTRECGQRDADRVYLNSGSPFVMIKEGEAVSLTTSIYQTGTLKPYHWRQAPGSPGMSSGLGWMGYDAVYVGRLVNRDTTIGLERTYYAISVQIPYDTIDFVACQTKIYSADGQAHDHVTFGDVVDWNVPSDLQNQNVAKAIGSSFVLTEGTDTTGGSSCQNHSSRFAVEAFGGWCKYREFYGYCWATDFNHGGSSLVDQALLRDTAFLRDGTPLDPVQPNPVLWWEAAGSPGLQAGNVPADLAVLLIYKYDFLLPETDTLAFWTVFATVREGTVVDLANEVKVARDLFIPLTCQVIPEWNYCNVRVGDVNGFGGDEPTIADISTLIDCLFISEYDCGTLVHSLAEADVNRSAYYSCYPTAADITISDISVLIDYLFITGSELGLPWCCFDYSGR